MEVFRIINTFFQSNTFILYNECKEAYIIDCGNADQIIKWIKDNNKILSGIFLTHTHFDHIYGLNELLNEYKELKVYSSSFGSDALFDARKNLSHYHENPFLYEGCHVEILENSDKVLLWKDITLHVIETVGHDKSCLTYSIDNFIFTGDSYIPGIKVITTFPNASKEDAMRSEETIQSMISENTIICPGHGEICRVK